MKEIVKNLKVTIDAGEDAAEELAKAMSKDFAINIEQNFKEYLNQAKDLLNSMELVEKTFENLKKSGALTSAFHNKQGEFSSGSFTRSGKENFKDNLTLQHQLGNIKTCLMRAFTFVETLKKAITGYEEKYLVGIRKGKDMDSNGIVGIIELEDILKSATLAVEHDGQTLKLMIGSFETLQKSLLAANANASKELQTLHSRILNRFDSILKVFKSFNRGKSKEDKITISAGYVFEVAIKSLNQQDSQFDNLLANTNELIEYYRREKSNVPFFREGDINDISILQQYLENNPLLADQYSVKMVASTQQLYGPSIATIKTLKSVLTGIVMILSQDLSFNQLQATLKREVFSTETSSGPLKITKLKESLIEGLSDTVASTLEEKWKQNGIKFI